MSLDSLDGQRKRIYRATREAIDRLRGRRADAAPKARSALHLQIEQRLIHMAEKLFARGVEDIRVRDGAFMVKLRE